MFPVRRSLHNGIISAVHQRRSRVRGIQLDFCINHAAINDHSNCLQVLNQFYLVKTGSFNSYFYISIHSFVDSHQFVHSPIRPFALSPNRTFFHSSINQHIRMSVRPFFVLTIVHPFIHSFIYCVFIRLFLHLSFRPYSSIHSILYLFTSLLH